MGLCSGSPAASLLYIAPRLFVSCTCCLLFVGDEFVDVVYPLISSIVCVGGGGV